MAEVDVRGMAGERGCSSTTAMLGRLLRITRREASSRIRAARQLAPHRALTGEELAPAYPVLAAAQAEGAVSGEQARIITSAIEKLPAKIRDEHGQSLEQTLTEEARKFTPEELRLIARKAADCLDPDGTLAHHVVPFAHDQRTCVDQGCLACHPHHLLADREGWTCEMRDGKAHWTPPDWLREKE